MPTSRLPSLSVVLTISLATAAGAATFDYTTLWTHLADMELDRYNYDCGGVVDVAVKGHFAYAVDGWQGLQVVDCTDPTSIAYRGFVSVSRPVACDVRDHFVYIVQYNGQLAVVDVDDHDAPVLLNVVSAGGAPRDLRLLGPWLYVLTGDDTLRIFSIAAASTPVPTGTVSLPAGRSGRLDIDGTHLFVAGAGGLTVFDVATPDWPAVLGSLDFAGAVTGLDARDNLVLVGQSAQSRLVDVSDPAAMIELDPIPSEGNGVLLTSNGQAWLGWGICWDYCGMRVFDVSDPTQPELLREEVVGFRGWPEAMVEYQGKVFVGEFMCWCAGEWPAFHVFQLGTLPAPAPLATRTRNGIYGLLRAGQRVDIATSTGIETWDLADPTAPELVVVLDESSQFRYLTEDAGVIATNRRNFSSSWLRVVTRDPDGGLVARGEVPVDDHPNDLAISGTLVLLAYTGGGLVAVDVTDPDSPTVAGTLLAGETVSSVALHGDLAVASLASGLAVLDIADLQNPQVLAAIPHGSYWKRHHLAFIERDGHLLLSAARNQGYNYDGGFVDVFDLTDPVQPTLLVEQRQLAMMDVGAAVWRGDLLAVAGATHLTFYRWTGVDAPVTFAGRVPQRVDLLYPDVFSAAAVVDQAVAVVNSDGLLQTWPLPEGLLTAAPQQPAGAGPARGPGGAQSVQSVVRDPLRPAGAWTGDGGGFRSARPTRARAAPRQPPGRQARRAVGWLRSDWSAHRRGRVLCARPDGRGGEHGQADAGPVREGRES